MALDKQQFSLLDQFAEKATHTEASPEQVTQPQFLSNIGIGDKLQQAGISGNSLLKGLISIAAPFVLSRMFSRRGAGAGMSGGRGGGMFGGGGGGMFGGLGSLIGMLAGGRGMGSLGGLFGRKLGF